VQEQATRAYAGNQLLFLVEKPGRLLYGRVCLLPVWRGFTIPHHGRQRHLESLSYYENVLSPQGDVCLGSLPPSPQRCGPRG